MSALPVLIGRSRHGLENQFTISPELLQKLTLDEKMFHLKLNDDARATEKLAEGMRGFCVDSVKLEKIIEELC